MKTERKVLAVLVILLAAAVCLFCYFYSSKVPTTKNPDEFIEKIDSLDSKIDSVYVIRDSIKEKIDTVYIKLEDNNKQYEENFNRVINNDVSEDYVFFHDYINNNRARLDSISNSL